MVIWPFLPQTDFEPNLTNIPLLSLGPNSKVGRSLEAQNGGNNEALSSPVMFCPTP